MTARHLVWASCVTAALLLAPQAAADEKPVTKAQQAFDEARALMEQGRYTEACAKFEKSQRLDAGMATQFRLAECYEEGGKLASAWRNFKQVASAARAAGMKDREAFAQKRVDALEPKLSRLTIEMPESVASLDGLRVTIDGDDVAAAQWSGFPLDAGKHDVLVRAPYHEEYQGSVDIMSDGEAITVNVPELASTQQQATVVEEDDGSTLLIVGIVVGVVGVAGMAAGIGVGAKAKSDWDESSAHCEGQFCRQEGLDIREDARTTGDIGTGIFVAGAVLTAAGLGISLGSLALGGDEQETAVRVDAFPGGLRAGVSW